MIHILFLVLKIIGMILLTILGILILLLCMVFFIPVNYQVQTSTDDGINALTFEAKAHWLLHLFSAYYVYKDKKSDWQVRIGWKTFNHKDNESKVKEDNVEETSVKKDKSEKTQDESKDKKSEEEVNQKQTWFEKIKCTILKICDKIKSLWEAKEKVTAFLTDDVHVEAFKIIKKEIGILAGHLSPRRIKGFVRYGFEDPYQTGQILAALSIFYPFYGENVEIYPNFEEKILKGDLYIKGHIRTIHFALLLWRLFFNRYIRITYRDFKRLKLK